jgi:hypothetical protein
MRTKARELGSLRDVCGIHRLTPVHLLHSKVYVKILFSCKLYFLICRVHYLQRVSCLVVILSDDCVFLNTVNILD